MLYDIFTKMIRAAAAKLALYAVVGGAAAWALYRVLA